MEQLYNPLTLYLSQFGELKVSTVTVLPAYQYYLSMILRPLQ